MLPGKASDPSVTAKNNRVFVDAVLWQARKGNPWRNLPEGFGNWNSVFKRYRRWVKGVIFDRMFKILSDEFVLDYVLVGGTIVRAHKRGIGRSRG